MRMNPPRNFHNFVTGEGLLRLHTIFNSIHIGFPFPCRVIIERVEWMSGHFDWVVPSGENFQRSTGLQLAASHRLLAGEHIPCWIAGFQSSNRACWSESFFQQLYSTSMNSALPVSFKVLPLSGQAMSDALASPRRIYLIYWYISEASNL